MAAKLLACSSEELTLNALKLIGMVFHHLPQRSDTSPFFLLVDF